MANNRDEIVSLVYSSARVITAEELLRLAVVPEDNHLKKLRVEAIMAASRLNHALARKIHET